MRDYKELIEALRSFANSYVQMFGKGESSQLMNDASGAIEDLIAALTASNEVIAKSKPKWISVEDENGQV